MALMPRVSPHRARHRAAVLAVAALACVAAACGRVAAPDDTALNELGFSWTQLQALRALEPTQPEIDELVKVRRARVEDAACVELVRNARARGGRFAAGDAVAALRRAGAADRTIVELDRLARLASDAGELQAMRLAGFSDEALLELARARSAGEPALSGPSLAALRNAGVAEATLLELLRRRVPDSEAQAILALRRRGARDAEILRRYSGR
jgi:hypothetical protein